MRIPVPLSVTAIMFSPASHLAAQAIAHPIPYSFADVADRALAGSVAMTATVSDAIRLTPEQAPGVPQGQVRLLVTADAKSLIRGPGHIPPRVRYLADVPLDEKGRAPRLHKKPVLILGRAVAGKPGELQLVSPDAQFPLESAAEVETMVRRILTQATGPEAPPAVTGVTGAFNVTGTIQGESETQIFLATANRPISLAVLRRPGQARRWSVALTEIVDEGAEPPAKDTLLWYRLACGLPRRLPNGVTEALSNTQTETVRADYRFVLDQLGPCTRNRPLKTN